LRYDFSQAEDRTNLGTNSIQWARKAKLFRIQHPETNLLDMTGNALEEAWLSWVQIEVRKRHVQLTM
jgi:hypothetical protein